MNIMKSIFMMCTVALLPLLCSCGNEKENKEDLPDNGVPYDGASERQYIENTANEILKYINPNDQATAVNALNAFCYYCNNYAFPENTGFSRSGVSDDMAELADMVSNCDVQALSRAAASYVYRLSNYTGLYQANDKIQEWQYTESRDDITFRYWLGNYEFNLMIKGEGGYITDTFTDNGETYTVEVPKELKLVLYSGSFSAYPEEKSQLIYINVKSDLKFNDHMKTVTSIKFANLLLEYNANATNSKMDEDMVFYSNNVATYYRTKLMASKSQYTGSSLCSPSAWMNAARQDNVASMVSSATSIINFMDMVQIKANVTNVPTFFGALSGGLESTDKTYADTKAAELSSSVKAQVFFSGEKEVVRANLGWEPYAEEDWSGAEIWGVRPTITFVSDNVPVDFGSYFGNGRFLSLEKSLSSLFSSYSAFWKLKV